MKSDFDKVNHILAGLFDDVQQSLEEVWPFSGLLSRSLGSIDNDIINFSMQKARDAAWSFAQTLAPLSDRLRQQEIVRKDQSVALFSQVISHPGLVKSLAIKVIRLGERGTTRQRIEILE